MSNILMTRGTETLSISQRRADNTGLLQFTIEKRDAAGKVTARNFVKGRASDMFNLRCKAWNEGWK